jgi:peroxiredoxin
VIQRMGRGIRAGLIIVLTIACNAAAVESPTVTELMKGLSLSGYSSSMRPPDFSGGTADGATVSLASLRGKVVLLNFWATWCQECRPEMPAFERMHRKLAAQGLSVLGINAREGTAAIRAYAKELGLTFPLVTDSKGEINAAYGVIGLPTTFVIARDGRAVARGVGPREWGNDHAWAIIRALLAEQAATKKER